jgi:hypothetical protein
MRGRIRTYKPEVFLDEELWDLEVQTGLHILRAYEGLWSFSDREGRFEWRPRALKARILPYWDGDFAAVLAALERAGFIVRYEVDGREYGWVPTLSEHQSFNAKEPPSVLPPPPPATREARVKHAWTPEHVPARVEGNGNGREREGNGAGTDARVAPPSNDVTPAVAEPKPKAPRSPKRAPPRPERVEPQGAAEELHGHFPEGWRWSSETEAAAAMAGVTPADLAEHVAWWTPRRWSVPVHDLDGALRAALSSIRKRAETERAKALAPPRAGPRSRNSEALDYAFQLATGTTGTAEGAS